MAYKELVNEGRKVYSNNELTDNEVSNLQKSLLICYEELSDVCEKYGISIFLQGGSLLGAVRHSGFIPWDDDMDFGMLRKDYNMFINIFERELSDLYYLSVPNYNQDSRNRFMQVYRKNTTVIQGEKNFENDYFNCLCIDIFPIDFAPNNIVCRLIKGIYANLIMVIASCVDEYERNDQMIKKYLMTSFIGRAVYYLKRVIGICFSFKNKQFWFDYLDRVVACEKQSDYLTSALGRKHYLNEVVPTSSVLPLKQIKFDKFFMKCPNKPSIYLNNLYGKNYMDIPDEEKREKHFYTFVDVSELLR